MPGMHTLCSCQSDLLSAAAAAAATAAAASATIKAKQGQADETVLMLSGRHPFAQKQRGTGKAAVTWQDATGNEQR